MKSVEKLLMEYDQAADFLGFQKAIRAFASCVPSKPDDALADLRVALVSNYSTQFIAAALRPALIKRNVWASIFADEYNQWEISPLNLGSKLYASKPDVIIFLISSIPLAYSPNSAPADVARRIGRMIALAHERSGARLVVSLPEPLVEETSVYTWAYEWRAALLSHLTATLPKTCICISLEPLIRNAGNSKWYSHRYFVASKFVFHPENTRTVANYLADTLADLVAPRVKLVITDLDNTLWGGVVGETGCANVNLDYQDMGYGHIRLQRFLAYLNRQGVLLAIVSKNNANDAREVFQKRPEMILTEPLFSSVRMNWERKSKNIQDILNELNLSRTGVVFLDDSPFEREEVKQTLPGIVVPELSKDPSSWVDDLLRLGIFYRHSATREDSSRVELYRVEKNRQAQKDQFLNEDEFLDSLNLRLRARSYHGNEQRVSDLFLKTNQFNLTTRRRAKSELDKLLSNNGQIFIFELEDKFGSYGIVAVCLILPSESDAFIIDSFLMSCRVLGRGVERAVLESVVTWVQKHGGRKLVGEYVPTEKNAVVARLYEELGFRRLEPQDRTQRYELDLSTSVDLPKHHCAFS